VSAAAVAVLVGAIVGQEAVRLRSADAGPGIFASVTESGADTPEAYGVSGPGEELPGNNVTGPAPAPASTSAPAAAPAIAPTGRPTATPVTVFTRVPKPVLPAGPRRVGIQAGHWETEKAPPELWRLLTQTGTSWNGINEVTINLDVANRVKRILERQGLVVDVLPTTIPPGYVADAFVALHGDGDGTGANSGFKMAFSSRRTPYEAALLQSIKTHYGAATGLSYDAGRISRQMLGYYAMSWTRNKYSTAPHTPSVILEMGYVSNDGDRELMMERPDVVAGGIAEGILRFLETHPRDKLFGQDLIVPAVTQFRAPTPSPSPAN
jgi:N-acetylmuramoyl-L-alanine amidase